jgi:hypothetical protein
MRRAAVLVFAALLGAFPGPVRAGDPPKAPAPLPLAREEVDRLLSELASDRYEVREAARRKLQAVAASVRDLLAARRDDPDPEVRRTVRALLASLGEDEASPPARPSEDARQVGLVTLSGRGTLRDVLHAMDLVERGRVRVPDAAAETRVVVAADARPYFEVLDAVLAQAGLDLEDSFDEAGQASAVARQGPPTVAPACVGPFRLEVGSVTATKSLRPAGGTRFTVQLRLLWSPSVHLVSYGLPVVAAATDAAGVPFRVVPNDANVVGAPAIGGPRGLGLYRRPDLVVTLEPPAGSTTDLLASLVVRMPLLLRHGLVEAEFPEPTKGPWPVVREGSDRAKRPWKATLTAFGPEPEQAAWTRAAAAVALPVGVPQDGMHALLEAADGTLRPMWAGTRIQASDGSVSGSWRVALGKVAAAPAALRIVWYERDQHLPFEFALRDVPLR